MAGIETGASFSGEIAVTVDGRARVVTADSTNYGREGNSLGLGAGVFRSFEGVETADVAYSNRQAVVVEAMSPDLINVSSRFDSAIIAHNEMVANISKPALAVPLPNIFCREILPLLGGGAVDNYFIDGANRTKQFVGEGSDLSKDLRLKIGIDSFSCDGIHNWQDKEVLDEC